MEITGEVLLVGPVSGTKEVHKRGAMATDEGHL